MHIPQLSAVTLLLLGPGAVFAAKRSEGERRVERREAEIKFTNVEEVNQKNRSGALSYGATGLALGYEAGAGISFDNVTVGGGFNAGIPGQASGNVGGGWSVTAQNLTIGLGATWANQSVSVAINVDAEGKLVVLVNGVAVKL